ncbi:YraN family protein [Hahella sp. SMD15-11]|uniref:UPF0102 protein AAIA72_00110 n=1 Tax=Thermohahella caldifontis TaxID=3142973 RepID=A0AB39UVY1_9GAMM
MTHSPTQITGFKWEARAEAWLRSKGLEPVTRNFRCKTGEIDLIMQDGDTLVFVEVKYRRTDLFASPLEQITPAKQRKLRRTAEFYLQRLASQPPCRFDVVSFTSDTPEWIQNAF